MAEETFVLEFPSSYKWLNMIDLICSEVAAGMDFSSNALNEISISVIEACTNALEHGNKCCPDCNVRVVFRRLDDRIVIEVTDCGEGFDFEDYLSHIPDPSDIHKKRGRGIYIMNAMMDTLNYKKVEKGGMKVILEKMIDGGGEEGDD
jgi:serine/threonine-protein kinase RsbW